MQIRLHTHAVLPGLVAIEKEKKIPNVNRPGKGKPKDPYKYIKSMY